MPFGRKAKPCRVFEYGCLPPVSGKDELLKELRLRNNYWNKLVEIDRLIRQRSALILLLPGDIEAAHLDAQIDLMRGEIKKGRQRTRSSITDADLKQRIKDSIAELRVLWEQNKKDRKPLIETTRADLAAIETEWRVARKAARADSGLYWCNYDDVDTAYDVARKETAKKWAFPKFRRFDGTGKVTVRWQNGLNANNVFDGTGTLLQIAPVHQDAWNHPVRSNRRKASRTTVRFRVRSENRSPVWVELPMVMHRPLPAGGEIRSASLVCGYVGGKPTYKLVITVAPPAHTLPEEGMHRGIRPTVGINLGWRKKDNDIRIAYWADEEGRHGELTLTSNTLAQFSKLNDLKSIRDKYFNEAISALALYISEGTIPDWLKADTTHLNKWRSKPRLLALVGKWRETRFTGDEIIYEALFYWRGRELHLHQWEANLRDQVQRHRRERYRIFAAQLAKDYSQIFIENHNLVVTKKKKATEDGTYLTTEVDTLRTIASPGILRGQIENACRREGVIFTKLDAKHITSKCHICGWQEKWNAAATITRECPGCKTEWDQDYNAARLLLQRGLDGGYLAVPQTTLEDDPNFCIGS
ncbi:MAG: hypothetical protein DDT32_00847 [Syntrophomonadaceae bacterium]|nr:hypothetical protein [Bacillota bacterium]